MTSLSLVVINGASANTSKFDDAANCLTWKLHLYLGDVLFTTLMDDGKLESYSKGRFHRLNS